MFTSLLSYVPLASILAVALVSIFNIGYFTRVGLHFLGVMDISNLVYPIGLVFAILLGLFSSASGIDLTYLRNLAEHPDIPKKYVRASVKYGLLPHLILTGAALYVSWFTSFDLPSSLV